MLHVDGLVLFSTRRLIDRFTTKMQEMQFLERDLTMYGLYGKKNKIRLRIDNIFIDRTSISFIKYKRRPL